ncbi:MAG: ornithine cyclodeaminase family protein [Candidatus Caldarchaeum sp.]|nr:ornithine cyclodeaminase family protein [Candidatus Caldarchaeum sp.]
MKYLTDEDVARIVDPAKAVEVVEQAYKLYSLKQVVMPVRSRIEAREKEGDILLMPCYVPAMNIFSLKLVSVYPRNTSKGLPTINAVVVVLDAETGVANLVAEARALTGLRTAAASAVSMKHLARKDASKIAVVGCGYQAGWQVRVIGSVFKGVEFMAFDVDTGRMKAFVDSMCGEGFDVKPAVSAEQAVKRSDVVVTVTTSKTPVVFESWVKDGTHISAIGGYTPEMVEIDPSLTARCKLVVDSREAVMEEAGDIIKPIQLGLITVDKIHAEIGEVVAGLKTGRENDREKTLFKSVGLAVQDAAVSKALVDHLMAR